jgi:hypothetical protein
MRRLHLFEFGDQPWFPQNFRPVAAKAILQDAFERRCAICIFESAGHASRGFHGDTDTHQRAGIDAVNGE